MSGGIVDLEKARRIVLADYRNQKLGNLTLDGVNEEPLATEDDTKHDEE